MLSIRTSDAGRRQIKVVIPTMDAAVRLVPCDEVPVVELAFRYECAQAPLVRQFLQWFSLYRLPPQVFIAEAWAISDYHRAVWVVEKTLQSPAACKTFAALCEKAGHAGLRPEMGTDVKVFSAAEIKGDVWEEGNVRLHTAKEIQLCFCASGEKSGTWQKIFYQQGVCPERHLIRLRRFFEE